LPTIHAAGAQTSGHGELAEVPDVVPGVLLDEELLGGGLLGAGLLELGAALDEDEVLGEGLVVAGPLELPGGLGLEVGE
jgi:hypothetical protein